MLLAGCWAAAACATSPAAPAAAPDPLAVTTSGPLSGAQWSVLAVDLATGEALLARNPAQRMIPASAMKLLTAVAALDVLGPEYRWDTDLWLTGTGAGAAPAETDTVAGDLVLVASGDPTWSARFNDTSTVPLERLVDQLEAAGVRRVGRLVVDASGWDSTSVRPSWMVEDLPLPAGASGGGLALAEGETRVEVSGGAAPGAGVSVRWWPLGEEEFVRSRLVTTPDAVRSVTATWLPESRAIELAGSVPVGSVDTLVLATRDPVRQAAAALHREVTRRGIAVEGGWRIAWDTEEELAAGCRTGAVPTCPGARRVAEWASPPLVEVLDAMLGPSRNWIAEQVTRTLGAERATRAGWPDGLAAVRDHVMSLPGVDPTDVRVDDGSGLSVKNLVTARTLVALLRYARAQPWSQAFQAALAEPGEEESTLETRLLDLEGRVHAKTGTLTNVVALAGYLIDERDVEVAFAILVNGSNLPGSTVQEAIDHIVRVLATGR